MKRAVRAALLSIATFTSALARAEEVPRNVEITIAGGDAEAAPLEATIRELLDRVSLAALHGPAPASTALLSRVTVDLSKPDVATVSVVDARDGRVLMSRALIRDRNPSITREEIAHAIQSAVEAELLKREPPPEPAPEPAAPPSPPPSAPVATLAPVPTLVEAPAPRPAAPSSFALDVATFAAAGPIAKSSGVAPRVGGGLRMSLPSSSLRPSLFLSGAYAPPFESGDDVIRARASFASLRALPAIEIVSTPSIALDWGVGGGVDLLTVTPVTNVLPSSSLGSPSTDADVIATTMLVLRADIVPSVFFFASAGLEVDALTRPYVARRGPDEEQVFAPWRVRPMLALGFAFTAVGHR